LVGQLEVVIFFFKVCVNILSQYHVQIQKNWAKFSHHCVYILNFIQNLTNISF
jgi:hypothetical protein